MSSPGEITRLVAAANGGDGDASQRLLQLLYGELERLARRQLAGHRRSTLLDTSDLVHEAYLKLAGGAALPEGGRGHLLAVAARAMRQIAIDHARARAAQKRGGGLKPVTLDENHAMAVGPDADLLALDQALDRLADLNPRLARVVECRYFAGLTEEETATALEVSVRTAQRDWLKARGWLRREMGAGGAEGRA